jgi:hypothetical protein
MGIASSQVNRCGSCGAQISPALGQLYFQKLVRHLAAHLFDALDQMAGITEAFGTDPSVRMIGMRLRIPNMHYECRAIIHVDGVVL